jgi:hypothetical protein
MLAQSWLYGRRVKTPHDAVIEKYLRLPNKFNPHSSVAVLNRLAERIVFTDDVPSLLYEMHDNKQLTYEGVIHSAKLPFDVFWLEYRSVIGVEGIVDLERAEYGALVVKDTNDRVRMYIVIGTRFNDGMSFASLAYVVEFPSWPPIMQQYVGRPIGTKALQFYVNYAYNREKLANGDMHANDTLGGIVTELIFGIFLVTQPRTYIEQKVEWHPKKQAAREKHGKPPLLEYRHIRMRISKPIKRYNSTATATTRGFHMIGNEPDTESSDAITHRRYHKVMGHFRHYLHHDPAYTVWIEPHYRGDPALGITFTERDVTK